MLFFKIGIFSKFGKRSPNFHWDGGRISAPEKLRTQKKSLDMYYLILFMLSSLVLVKVYMAKKATDLPIPLGRQLQSKYSHQQRKQKHCWVGMI